jgi:hypothetical protein
MMNEELLIEELLLKYRFTEPVPVEYKSRIAASKKNSLVIILKKNKNYGLVIWAALITYMFFRKLGFAVSFAQAAVISGITAAAVAVTVTAGSVKAISIVNERYSSEEKRIVYDETPVEVLQTQPVRKSAVLMQFSGTLDAGYLSSRATAIFADTLKKEMGEGNFSYGREFTDKKFIITGSVEKLPEGYLLSSRIIDKSSSVIIHMDMKEISGEEFS